jgi:hypothetical protein
VAHLKAVAAGSRPLARLANMVRVLFQAEEAPLAVVGGGQLACSGTFRMGIFIRRGHPCAIIRSRHGHGEFVEL